MIKDISEIKSSGKAITISSSNVGRLILGAIDKMREDQPSFLFVPEDVLKSGYTGSVEYVSWDNKK